MSEKSQFYIFPESFSPSLLKRWWWGVGGGWSLVWVGGGGGGCRDNGENKQWQQGRGVQRESSIASRTRGGAGVLARRQNNVCSQRGPPEGEGAPQRGPPERDSVRVDPQGGAKSPPLHRVQHQPLPEASNELSCFYMEPAEGPGACNPSVWPSSSCVAVYTIADKPNAPCNSQRYEDAAFTAAFRRAAQGPREKFSFPQTEAQEVGWNNAPLIDTDRTDRRLNFPRQGSEITTYMEAAWRLKEQTQNLK
ncbi:cilia- and flagella-associated protein 144 isoform X1 [Petromyzon marinus]|uniref:cilia- and flagella-associated protein 144 isoform X1 n=1 Tax=Petromyzon marinus TaxID=7757 RepID=UPI003F71E632